jgi:adenylate kinase
MRRSALIIGPPGTGKGTQGSIIGKVPGFRHFSMGDMLRSQDKSSKLGLAFSEFADRGELVPDELVMELLMDATSNMSADDVAILDGFPRNVRQTELMRGSIDVVSVISLTSDDEEALVSRIKKRIGGRKDDADESVIRRRMLVYKESTEPVLSRYPSQIIHQVNALLTPPMVLAKIMIVLAPLHDGREF